MSILSRFGIGSASIDLIPDQTRVHPGGCVEAHLELSGGSSAQTVDDIEIALVTRYRAQREDDSYPTHYVLWETEFKQGFTVDPGVDRSIDVPDIEVPAETPVTVGGTEVWIQTGLDIDWALDPSDEDQLNVRPSPALASILEGMEELGFELRSVSNEEVDLGHRSAPFLQRFRFVPGASVEGMHRSVYLWPDPTETEQDMRVLLTRDELGAASAPASLALDAESGTGTVGQLRRALDRL